MVYKVSSYDHETGVLKFWSLHPGEREPNGQRTLKASGDGADKIIIN